MTPFFFYQYNDTQLSCVFEKKKEVLVQFCIIKDKNNAN